ncbi:hypothetical protein KX928_08805 [Roseobacter sp. YSTF-M11]|uniref:D-galactarate dehydratase n=1 Tax=Roseobacter insulae TaxID=2859783 RepID=A0A9X1FUF9_9RHOB|nr:hypothetical protein [Roseobacter insulae]MBW4707883.1 hypothetical protein [Roseobacter insulae]
MIDIWSPSSLVLACALAVSGCAELGQLAPSLAPLPEVPEGAGAGAIPTKATNTADVLDQTTAAERSVAAAAGSAGPALGQTVVSLGSPTEPGFWLKTPLVAEQTPGKVRNPATGKSVAVTLIPIAGPQTAGSRLSLAAMRVLEVRLTDLVTVDVSL